MDGHVSFGCGPIRFDPMGWWFEDIAVPCFVFSENRQRDQHLSWRRTELQYSSTSDTFPRTDKRWQREIGLGSVFVEIHLISNSLPLRIFHYTFFSLARSCFILFSWFCSVTHFEQPDTCKNIWRRWGEGKELEEKKKKKIKKKKNRENGEVRMCSCYREPFGDEKRRETGPPFIFVSRSQCRHFTMNIWSSSTIFRSQALWNS